MVLVPAIAATPTSTEAAPARSPAAHRSCLIFFRFCLVNDDGLSAQLSAIKPLDSFLSLLGSFHFDKAEPFSGTAESIFDDIDRQYGSNFGEIRPQVVLGDLAS